MRKDKCWIMQSPLGAYTLPWSEDGRKYYTYLNKNGTLNREAVNMMAYEAAYYGANAVREFPFFPHKDMNLNRHRLTGFVEFGDQFFKDWREIAEIYNSYGVTVFLELFDYCGTRNFRRTGNLFGLWNPWNVSYHGKTDTELINGNFFWGPESLPYRRNYIERFIAELDGLNVCWGICNEPRVEKVDVKMMATFLADTFVQLIKSGIPAENILLPIEYNLKESKKPEHKKYGTLYRRFREQVCRRLKSDDWEQWLKNRCISAVHGATPESVKEILKDAPIRGGGTRNLQFSTDGVRSPRPTKETIGKWVGIVFREKANSARNGKMHFEAIRKQEGDPVDATLGISNGYSEFYGKLPYNLYRIKKPLPLLEPGKEPGSIEPGNKEPGSGPGKEPDKEPGNKEPGSGPGKEEINMSQNKNRKLGKIIGIGIGAFIAVAALAAVTIQIFGRNADDIITFLMWSGFIGIGFFWWKWKTKK